MKSASPAAAIVPEILGTVPGLDICRKAWITFDVGVRGYWDLMLMSGETTQAMRD